MCVEKASGLAFAKPCRLLGWKVFRSYLFINFRRGLRWYMAASLEAFFLHETYYYLKPEHCKCSEYLMTVLIYLMKYNARDGM